MSSMCLLDRTGCIADGVFSAPFLRLGKENEETLYNATRDVPFSCKFSYVKNQGPEISFSVV